MNEKRIILACVICGVFSLNLAFADREIGHSYDKHDDHDNHNDGITVIYGERSVLGVQVKTDDGFVEPEIGVTDESAILYNVPADGTDPVPLRQVATLYITDGPNPVVIDESISADNTTRGLVFPGAPNPMTLGDWLNGKDSKLKLKSLDNGMTKVKLKVKGLLPNSLYGVWQFNVAPGAPGPFGGIPNIFVTDHKGNATMQRMLPFNMLEVVRRLAIVYHSDHRVYGGTPSVIDPFGGHDIHVHLEFNIADME